MASLDLEISSPDGIPFRARRNHVHTTWAKTFTSHPELYIQPDTIPELRKALSLARRHRRRITVVGSGHSPSPLTLTRHWCVNLDRFDRILSLDQEKRLVTAEAGIRLRDLSNLLDEAGLALKNLGSIEDQSIAGVVSTGTHGSSLHHGLLGESVVSFKMMLSDGSVKSVSADAEDQDSKDLFRAGLLGLGALGVVVEMTWSVRPAFLVAWSQTIDADSRLLASWSSGWWAASEFKRVWWFPYTRRAVVWQGDEARDAPPVKRPFNFYDGWLGYQVYHNLLYLAQWVPRILPRVEWFVFGMQYGFANGTTIKAVEPSRDALLMNCLYSQFVNEWAIPLQRGPEALRRLSTWLNNLDPSDPQYVDPKIPFSAEGLYVHAPVEVRVVRNSGKDRQFLDPTVEEGDSLLLNATLYRPYLRDPPCRERYYEAFEWLMKDMGGRPHWAKNFSVSKGEIEGMYGAGPGRALGRWRAVRDKVDPEGMFVGPWHRGVVLEGSGCLSLEEVHSQEE